MIEVHGVAKRFAEAGHFSRTACEQFRDLGDPVDLALNLVRQSGAQVRSDCRSCSRSSSSALSRDRLREFLTCTRPITCGGTGCFRYPFQ